jgi:hypothetical protein
MPEELKSVRQAEGGWCGAGYFGSSGMELSGKGIRDRYP